MADWFGKLSDVAVGALKAVAPMAATAIGGPFGGVAAAAISKALGTSDSDQLVSMLEQGSPETLQAAATVDNEFTVEMEKLGIKREEIAAKLEIDREASRTERHAADMASDSWMSKNIRPITLVFLTIVYMTIVVLDSIGTLQFDVAAAHQSTIEILLTAVYGFYFVSRGVEKVVQINNQKHVVQHGARR